MFADIQLARSRMIMTQHVTHSSSSFSAEMVLREAELEVLHGLEDADAVLSTRLERISKDVSLPTPMRARAMSFLSRLG